MFGSLDHPQQLCFGYAAFGGLPNVPAPLVHGQSGLHDDHILCPVQTYCLRQQFRHVTVHPVEVPHPAQVAGREALGCGIGRLQVFRRRDSGAFFAPAADHSTDLAVQLHLRELRRHKRVQCGKHGGVVCGFTDIHGLSPFRRGAPDQRSKQRKAR